MFENKKKILNQPYQWDFKLNSEMKTKALRTDDNSITSIFNPIILCIFKRYDGIKRVFVCSNESFVSHVFSTSSVSPNFLAF